MSLLGGKWSAAFWLVYAAVVVGSLIARLLYGVIIHDQAELIVYGESWRLAYDEQMPVYVWITGALMRATAYFILVPDILKFAALTATVWAVGDMGRRLAAARDGDEDLGFAGAALIAFLLPTMNSDLLTEYPHTSGLMAFTALSSRWMLREVLEGPHLPRWPVALFWIFGLFAKHNMILIILLQMIAFRHLWDPDDGPWWRRLLPPFIATVLATLPIYAMLLIERQTLVSGIEEFVAEPAQWGAPEGLGDLLSSVPAEAGLVALLLLVLARAKRGAEGAGQASILMDTGARFLWLIVLGVIALFAVIILLADVSVVRDRWLAPAFLLLAPLGGLLIGVRTGIVARVTIPVLLVALAAVGTYRAVEPLMSQSSNDLTQQNLPYRDISSVLDQNFSREVILLTNDQSLAATVKVMQRSRRVYAPRSQHTIPSEVTEMALIRLERRYRHPLRPVGEDWQCEDVIDDLAPYRYGPSGGVRYQIARCERGTPA